MEADRDLKTKVERWMISYNLDALSHTMSQDICQLVKQTQVNAEFELSLYLGSARKSDCSQLIPQVLTQLVFEHMSQLISQLVFQLVSQ